MNYNINLLSFVTNFVIDLDHHRRLMTFYVMFQSLMGSDWYIGEKPNPI